MKYPRRSCRSLMLFVSTLVAVSSQACNKNKPAAGAAPAEQQAGGAASAPASSSMAQAPSPAPPDVAAPPADAQKTASGLASKVLQAGTSAQHPGPTDIVTVQYTGWTTDGHMFDSSYSHGKPLSFPVNRVIPGWAEGVQLMTLGEKRRMWIPETLAYKGNPQAPQGTLVFDVELIDIKVAPKPPETPADVAQAPKNATRTKSGLASKVLAPGKGTRHPDSTSTVTVHYTGWTTDGKLFDSSVMRGEPATFALNQVIPGWSEGVRLMVPGEKRRLWIPEKLAYRGRPGAPAGMLVFDIELISIAN